jgi:hypothetical protein
MSFYRTYHAAGAIIFITAAAAVKGTANADNVDSRVYALDTARSVHAFCALTAASEVATVAIVTMYTG